jgi:1,2-diacylglycerol 3-beta-glucosyltransferase
MMTVVTTLLWLAVIPALLVSGYLAVLTICSFGHGVPPTGGGRPRIAVVVPAHDEEQGIGRTVASLLAIRWPADRFAVVVVADNCSDETARVAEQAGARVLLRTDEVRRGKGFALDFAFERLAGEGTWDAVVVVDADTLVSPNLLEAMAARLGAGARAVQAEYAVQNPEASWRTRLMAVAFSIFHGVRSLGREGLGLSCGLRGNGMCFSMEALRDVPHRAFSVVEDLEYGIALGLAGVRVQFAPEARVYGEMVAGEVASRSQRRRWEGGRLVLARRHARELLSGWFRRKDPVLLDLALDLLVPPLSLVVAYEVAGAAAAGAAWAAGTGPWLLAAWLVALGLDFLYVCRGVAVSGMGWRGWTVLAWAPLYLAWKVVIVATSRRAARTNWVRTARGREAR